MRRRLFTLISALSLLLCVAVVALWVWSYIHTPGIVHQRSGRVSFLGAYRGRLMFESAGRVDTRAWPGWGGLRYGLGVVAPRSETLVIDAHPDLCRVLLLVLRSIGHQAECLHDGESTLRRLHEPQAPELLILDIMMPSMDGLEVLRRIRTDSDGAVASTKVIMCSALEDVLTREQCFDMGVLDYWVKGNIDFDTLKGRLAKALS